MEQSPREHRIGVTVTQFDERKALKVLKECPKIVQDYFKIIKGQAARWQDIAYQAIGKLKKEN
jgi:hypothetical protein